VAVAAVEHVMVAVAVAVVSFKLMHSQFHPHLQSMSQLVPVVEHLPVIREQLDKLPRLSFPQMD
jgi:hypothetical protein